MPRLVVEVMPKPEILDPQGTAITHALGRLGFTGLGGVRQGKRFEVTVDAADEATLARVREAALTMLSNPVIEDVVSVHVLPEDVPGGDGRSDDAPGGSGESGGAGEAQR